MDDLRDDPEEREAFRVVSFFYFSVYDLGNMSTLFKWKIV